LSNKSNDISNEIWVDTDGRQQVDFSGNQNKPEVSEESNSDSSKDDLAASLFTPNETPKPSFGAPLLLPID